MVLVVLILNVVQKHRNKALDETVGAQSPRHGREARALDLWHLAELDFGERLDHGADGPRELRAQQHLPQRQTAVASLPQRVREPRHHIVEI